jgi:hypothetical protein
MVEKIQGSASHVSDGSIIEDDDNQLCYLLVATPNSQKGC